MLDVIIKNGFVIDGSGNSWFKSDIGIKDEKIVKIGCLHKEQADKKIDAEGFFVSPGFIDAHTHHDVSLLLDKRLEYVVRQGITTLVTGSCGFSPFPINHKHVDLHKKHLQPIFPLQNIKISWKEVRDFSEVLKRNGMSVNISPMVGHGSLRVAVMGFEERRAEKHELEEMKYLLKELMSQGAIGLSTGLMYSPAAYADNIELVELCEVVSEYGGIFSTHIRSYGDFIERAICEMLDIARKSRVSIEFSHFRPIGVGNFGKDVISMLERAREEGIDANCDMYPYTAGQSFLSSLLPPWVHEGGEEEMLKRLRDFKIKMKAIEDMKKGLPNWSSLLKVCGMNGLVISYSKNHKDYEGKRVMDIAKSKGIDPYNLIVDTVLDDDNLTLMINFCANENDVNKVITHPLSMIGSDSMFPKGKPHPRVFGTFPKVIRKYVVEEKLLRIEEVIRKMTSLPATKHRLWNRGMIRPNFYADIVIFSLKEFKDKASYENPNLISEGVKHLIVNGELIINEYDYEYKPCGKVLLLK
jgi:N-acyl-D-aspartate/D-glutamate deacylase